MANRCVFLWHRHQIGMSHDTSNRRWQSIWTARPIFGGKVVIQAKRYKNTVGVSAVRDLFGTMQNEGASKGILVTTSGYGKASFEFAQNKPLELLSGSNLLYLLEEHAGITAKIEPPEDWAQPEEKSAGPSLSTSGETLTIEESMTLGARTENAGHVGDEHEWSWSR
jgi:hypothetical protein